jgi:hypothetical protein
MSVSSAIISDTGGTCPRPESEAKIPQATYDDFLYTKQPLVLYELSIITLESTEPLFRLLRVHALGLEDNQDTIDDVTLNDARRRYTAISYRASDTDQTKMMRVNGLCCDTCALRPHIFRRHEEFHKLVGKAYTIHAGNWETRDVIQEEYYLFGENDPTIHTNKIC